MDNVFIERLWRSLKHEEIYLARPSQESQTRSRYNDRQLHKALGYRGLMAFWRERMQAAKAVDMMDNADALTTCPQQQQQTKSLAA